MPRRESGVSRYPVRGCRMDRSRPCLLQEALLRGKTSPPEDTHWPGATSSLMSHCPTELTDFEAQWGLLRNPAGQPWSVTWFHPLHPPPRLVWRGQHQEITMSCCKATGTRPDYLGHRSALLNEAEALISDNYLLEKRSWVLSAPSKKLKDRRKLRTMGRGRCISAPVSKTRYCLTDE